MALAVLLALAMSASLVLSTPMGQVSVAVAASDDIVPTGQLLQREERALQRHTNTKTKGGEEQVAQQTTQGVSAATLRVEETTHKRAEQHEAKSSADGFGTHVSTTVTVGSAGSTTTAQVAAPATSMVGSIGSHVDTELVHPDVLTGAASAEGAWLSSLPFDTRVVLATRAGLAGMVAMCFTVFMLLPLQSALQVSCAYRTSVREAARLVHAQGGIAAFYPKAVPTLTMVSGLRFGDCFANTFLCLSLYPPGHEMPSSSLLARGLMVSVGTAAVYGLWRLVLLPLAAPFVHQDDCATWGRHLMARLAFSSFCSALPFWLVFVLVDLLVPQAANPAPSILRSALVGVAAGTGASSLAQLTSLLTQHLPSGSRPGTAGRGKLFAQTQDVGQEANAAQHIGQGASAAPSAVGSLPWWLVVGLQGVEGISFNCLWFSIIHAAWPAF